MANNGRRKAPVVPSRGPVSDYSSENPVESTNVTDVDYEDYPG